VTDDIDEWSAAVELIADVAMSPDELLDAVDDLMDVLADHAPAVSVGTSTLEVRMDVFAENPSAAADVVFKQARTLQCSAYRGDESAAT
jgi:hypothetical protein